LVSFGCPYLPDSCLMAQHACSVPKVAPRPPRQNRRLKVKNPGSSVL